MEKSNIDIDIGIKVEVKDGRIFTDAPPVLDVHEATKLRDKLTAAILELKGQQ
jgi:hypothetical protein